MSLIKYLKLSEKVNPCWLIGQPGGRFVLKHRLKLAGYAAKDDVLDALVEALYTGEIILLEGKPGSGKTMLYDGMREAFNLPDYQVRCNIQTSHADIIGKFESTLQNQYVIQTLSATDKPLEEVSDEQWTLRFFKAARPLMAYVNSPEGGFFNPNIVPNGLLLDEIDKLSETIQDSCLQLFNDHKATIDGLLPKPSLGLPDNALPPFVVFTSNNMRGGVSAPLRDRAGVYLYVETPTPVEEYIILKTKFPKIPETVLRQTLKLMQAVRQDDLIKQKPQIRAASKFVWSIMAWEIEDFAKGKTDNPLHNIQDTIRTRICYLAKDREDSINAKASITSYASFIYRKNSFDEIIEEGSRVFQQLEGEHKKQVAEFKQSV